MAGVKTAEPEILRPGEEPRHLRDPLKDQLKGRFGAAGGLFGNENLDLLSKLLDTWFRLPGTNIRFGLDGIIGFVPGIGDFLAGAASTLIVVAAFFRGVPLVTVLRMVLNLVVEVVVGAVPVLGNLFDIGWRANRRNYALLERSLEHGRRDTWKDWIFMGALALGLMCLVMLPFLLFLYVGESLFRALHLPGWR